MIWEVQNINQTEFKLFPHCLILFCYLKSWEAYNVFKESG